MSNDLNIPTILADIPGLDTSDPAVAALVQRIAELEAKTQRSPRQRKSFSEQWEVRLNKPVDKMPKGYQLIVNWLVDEGKIDESQAGLVYAACWAYQCEEGKVVRHDGGASREALKEARETLEIEAYVRMTTEEADSAEEDVIEDEEDTDDEDIAVDLDIDDDIEDEDDLDSDDED